MIKFLIYLLESSAILAVFYLLYVVMKKETFFNLNRFFLLGIVVFSLLLPLMSFDFSQGKIAVIDNSIEQFSKFRMSFYENAEALEYQVYKNPVSLDDSTTKVIETASIDWISILLMAIIGIYIIGVLFCLSKLFWNFRRLRKMILMHPQEQINGITVVKVSQPIAPFSFLTYAFVYDKVIDTPEIDQIIAHEKAHIEQKHSIDLICIQFLAAFLWFNPLIWMLINSLKAVHEYIVDKKIIKAGYSLVDYQTLLLRQLVSNNSCGLVHNFNLSFIKKRITMMKSNKSGFKGKLKVALTITCTILFSLLLFQCNSKTDEAEALLNKYEKDRGIVMNMSDTGFLRPPVFAVANDKLTVNGKPFTIAEIEAAVKDLLTHGVIPMRIDRNQNMKKVREIQNEFRKFDKRKVIYYGETASGKQMIQPFLVPPLYWADPSHDDTLPARIDLTNATIEGNVATLNGIEYLQLNVSSTGVNYKEEVYRFVKKHVDKKSRAYLISITYDDNDVFENYLTNLAAVFQGFEKIYDVRAQELFGKDRRELVERSEFLKISEGVYKGVFIAER
ncbi:M56 family metallopeptidase [uncultured Kordia sp.]|uniref:M56 family metallopeptidase n=1 Tax=uncultured Kordia sp. TaxID=507699 RepID=UPI0026066F49|nr:M56 family metallopeptidase [uncultured Kordia sp.]